MVRVDKTTGEVTSLSPLRPVTRRSASTSWASTGDLVSNITFNNPTVAIVRFTRTVQKAQGVRPADSIATHAARSKVHIRGSRPSRRTLKCFACLEDLEYNEFRRDRRTGA